MDFDNNCNKVEKNVCTAFIMETETDVWCQRVTYRAATEQSRWR